MQKHIFIDISNHKVAFAVSINGVELIVNRFHQLPSKQLPINQWVHSGINKFSINISINPQWSEELNEQSLQFSIIEYSGIRPDFISTRVASVDWHYVKDETAFPVNLENTFKLDIPYGDWLWKKAEVITDDTLPLESLKGYITRLHQILQNKNYDELEPLLKIKTEELANAYYIPRQERLNDQRTFFTGELFSDAAWGMAHIDFENMRVRYHAGGQLIEVVDKYGKPFLKALPGEETTFSLPLRLCYYNSNWVLCR